MTEAASAVPPQPALVYVQAWVESLAQVLGQISGSPLPCVVLPEAPAETPPAGEGDLWIVGACSAGLRGEMSLRLPAASILRLAQLFLSEPAAPEVEVTAEHREAVVELLRQVADWSLPRSRPVGARCSFAWTLLRAPPRGPLPPPPGCAPGKTRRRCSKCNSARLW